MRDRMEHDDSCANAARSFLYAEALKVVAGEPDRWDEAVAYAQRYLPPHEAATLVETAIRSLLKV